MCEITESVVSRAAAKLEWKVARLPQPLDGDSDFGVYKDLARAVLGAPEDARLATEAFNEAYGISVGG